MGDQSKIEWTDATWNFIIGCTQVSAGCDHCYAMTMHNKRHKAWTGGTFPDAPKQYHKPFSEVQIIPERLDLPLRWQKPRKIFVNSLADLFHKDVSDDVIDQAFAVMALTPRHTFQILTKRPQRMKRYLSDPSIRDRIHETVTRIFHDQASKYRENRVAPYFPWPLPNVWLGTSVEDQDAAYRIDYLIRTPAAVRFLSCEPLIGPLDLTDVRMSAFSRVNPLTGRMTAMSGRDEGTTGKIDWVIAGGESGAGHRPIDADWVRSLRDQCTDAGVAFLFKQWGGHTSKAGGRELDGRTWDQYPGEDS